MKKSPYKIAEELYDAKLCETISVGDDKVFIRVPNGWILMLGNYESRTSCFIPYDNEFYTYEGLGK
jgi:hypothetical protein